MEQVDSQPKPRKRKVDWLMVMRLIDELPDGEAALVGEFDQSVRTHIRKGRISYVDPSKYLVWTHRVPGKHRNRANLYMMRRPK